MTLPSFASMLSKSNYDTASATEYQIRYGISLDNSRGKSHRIPGGENEGLILRPQWHPEFTIGLEHDRSIGREAFVDSKSGRIFTLHPDNPRTSGMKELYA